VTTHLAMDGNILAFTAVFPAVNIGDDARRQRLRNGKMIMRIVKSIRVSTSRSVYPLEKGNEESIGLCTRQENLGRSVDASTDRQAGARSDISCRGRGRAGNAQCCVHLSKDRTW
jgi:hypothetical protein